MIRWYKNSFLASAISIIGCLMIMGGILTLADEMVTEGIIFIVIGLALAIWGKQISANKAFKTWWKQVTDADLEPKIAQSTDVAIQVYNKNPQKRTLKKIAELNPAAAENIERQLAAKK